MSYIKKNLMSGENITYRAKLHWIVFIRPIIFFVVSILLFIIANRSTDELIIGLSMSFGILIIVIVPFIAIFTLITYYTSEFGITNKRIIMKIGFIRRKSLEILLSKVESIQVNQGIIGRILGYGSLVVSGTGGTKDPFNKISKPLEFRRKTQEQILAIE